MLNSPSCINRFSRCAHNQFLKCFFGLFKFTYSFWKRKKNVFGVSSLNAKIIFLTASYHKKYHNNTYFNGSKITYAHSNTFILILNMLFCHIKTDSFSFWKKYSNVNQNLYTLNFQPKIKQNQDSCGDKQIFSHQRNTTKIHMKWIEMGKKTRLLEL